MRKNKKKFNKVKIKKIKRKKIKTNEKTKKWKENKKV